MAPLFRLILTLLTVLSLAGYTLASPADPTGATKMVICGDGGAETIWLDADGNPAKTPSECCVCLDCLYTTDIYLPVNVTAPRDLVALTGRAIIPQAEIRQTFLRLAPMPRGPPALQQGTASADPMMAETDVRRIAQAPLEHVQVMRGQSVAARRSKQKAARP